MATKHHNVHKGLQEHSVGNDYPWSVVLFGPQSGGIASAQPRNLVTGEHGPRFRGIDCQGQCERWICGQ